MNGLTKLIIAAKTEANLARQLGITPQAVSKWKVKGAVPISRLEEVSKLYPHIPVDELMGER